MIRRNGRLLAEPPVSYIVMGQTRPALRAQADERTPPERTHMSDEILLYLILLLMLVLAVGALVPSLLRVGREEASVEREDKAYGSAVTEALRRQRAQARRGLEVGRRECGAVRDSRRRSSPPRAPGTRRGLPRSQRRRRPPCGQLLGPRRDGRRGGGRHCGFGRPLCRERRARAHRA